MTTTALIPWDLSTLICGGCAWMLMALLIHSLWLALRQGRQHLRTLHQIPCAHCRYFTQDYRLKCTVHPCQALTRAAIACPDYVASTSVVLSIPEQ